MRASPLASIWVRAEPDLEDFLEDFRGIA